MPKVILSDEDIERARIERENLEYRLRHEMSQDDALAGKYEREQAKLEKQAVYKSRRIENAKSTARGRKLDIALVIAIVVLLAMIYYIIVWAK